MEGQESGVPTYGCPTYDAIFKHVFTDDAVRSSFFRAFIPGAAITSSTRLDTHINLAQEFTFLRTFIQLPAAAGGISDAFHAPPNDASVVPPPNDAAAEFLRDIVGGVWAHHGGPRLAFPAVKFDATMDFVCKMENGDHTLVQVHVDHKHYWYKRALAYLAAFYGNQLRAGVRWSDVNKVKNVIGISITAIAAEQNIFGLSEHRHYMRHHSFEERIDPDSSKRYIGGMQIAEYSVLDAAATPDKRGDTTAPRV